MIYHEKYNKIERFGDIDTYVRESNVITLQTTRKYNEK